MLQLFLQLIQNIVDWEVLQLLVQVLILHLTYIYDYNYIDVIHYLGRTVTITRKDCALGYYTFGHELGHNFGCTHNPENDTNTIFR